MSIDVSLGQQYYCIYEYYVKHFSGLIAIAQIANTAAMITSSFHSVLLYVKHKYTPFTTRLF